ncbi:MAG: hypothetical protein AAF587_43560 [Bacteroidota bacterium]
MEPLLIAGHTCYSPEQMIYSICLSQHKLFAYTDHFWTERPHLIEHPQDIYTEVYNFLRSFNMEFDAQWVFEIRRASIRVILELINHGNNDFAQEMYRIRGYQRDPYFIVVQNTKERYWQSGFGPNKVPNPARNMPGLNIWGEFLDNAFNIKFRGKELYSNHSLPTFYNYLWKYCLDKDYKKSAVIISDSSARRVRSIEGGSVWYQGAITCMDMAELLSSRFANLANFRYIIIFAGTNDSLLPTDQQERSYAKLRNLLIPLKYHPDVNVIWHTGIGVPGWPYVPAYTSWFRGVFFHDFNCANFHLCDWSRPNPYNVFIDDDGNPIPKRDGNGEIQYRDGAVVYRFLDESGRHADEEGIRAMWRHMAYGLYTGEPGDRMLDLRLVKVRTDRRHYLAGRMRDTLRLV